MSVKLVEPSTGRIVELKVDEKNEVARKIYLKNLERLANYLKEAVEEAKFVNGNTMKLIFKEGDMAEKIRQDWRGRK